VDVDVGVEVEGKVEVLLAVGVVVWTGVEVAVAVLAGVAVFGAVVRVGVEGGSVSVGRGVLLGVDVRVGVDVGGGRACRPSSSSQADTKMDKAARQATSRRRRVGIAIFMDMMSAPARIRARPASLELDCVGVDKIPGKLVVGQSLCQFEYTRSAQTGCRSAIQTLRPRR
jgi:hypothetical protein